MGSPVGIRVKALSKATAKSNFYYLTTEPVTCHCVGTTDAIQKGHLTNPSKHLNASQQISTDNCASYGTLYSIVKEIEITHEKYEYSNNISPDKYRSQYIFI